MNLLLDQPIIRIAIWYGAGMGNERATIVVMENLRHIGFKGKFDIRYATYRDDDTVTKDGVGEKLRTLISGFAPKNLYDPDGKYIPDLDWNVIDPILGDITVTRLPPPRELFALSRVSVTISGACDNVPMKMCEKFNTVHYIQLQPTGYPAHRYIAYMKESKQEKIALPYNLRLSPIATLTSSIDNTLNLSISEQQVYRLCEIPMLNSQLVYGIYHRKTSLDPILECKRLLKAHRLLQEKTPKKIILFFPQKICIDSTFQKTLNKSFNNLVWIDLTNQTLEEKQLEEMPNNTIILAYTGVLQSQVFDSLLLIKTNFPPVVEGENARELCESYGRPYLYGGRINHQLPHYDIDAKHLNEQELHITASNCLKQEDCTDVSPLAEYIKMSIDLDFKDYHINRRQAYLQKPDAIEYVIAEMNTRLETFESSFLITTETFEKEDELVTILNMLKETLETIKEKNSQVSTKTEEINKSKQTNNTGIILNCCTFSIGVCISYVTIKALQKTSSNNLKSLSLFFGFTLGAGLITRGRSLFFNSFCTQKSTNNKPLSITKETDKDVHVSSELSLK